MAIMKICMIVAFLLNAVIAKDYLYKEDSNVYLNYGVWSNKTGNAAPENDTFYDATRVIFMDDDLPTLPYGFLASFSALKEVQAEHCRLKKLKFDQESRLLGVQSLVVSDNRISMLADHAFSGVPALQTLKLQRNDIRNVSSLAFANLSKLSVLGLHHNRIRDLHPETFADLTELTYLDLSSNRIAAIESNVFTNNGKLEFLFLHKNVISVLAESAFVGATALLELSLSQNRLRCLEPHTFTKLKLLHTLNLDENHLQTFNLSFLSENVMLQKLTLTNNSLVQLVAGASTWNQLLDLDLASNELVDLSPLAGLTLQRLNVSNNQQLNVSTLSGLTRLDALFARSAGMVSLDAMNYLKNLTHLDATSNQIGLVSKCRLPSVEILILTANGLTALPDNGFSESHRLQRLFLSNNSLSSISASALAGLTALVELDLSGNLIDEMHLLAFAELKSLTRLFLSGNRIQNLASGLFEHNENLYRLDLSNNIILEFEVPASVKSLNLAGNKIGHLDAKSFENSSNLIKLDLASNQLVSFDFDVLEPCRHFRQLKLGANNLTELLATETGLQSDRPMRLYLENNGLSDISNLSHFDLQELDVSNNSHLQLQASSFVKFENLEFLGLQGVNLNASLLENGLLKELTQLKTLIIASNDLQIIDLTNLPTSLEYFNANRANLREIVGFKEMLEILPRLEVVDIAGNRWSCEYWTMMKENFRIFGVYQPESCPVLNEK